MPPIGSKCYAGVMNCFQELKFHRFSPSGKREHREDRKDCVADMSVGHCPARAKRPPVSISLVLGGLLILFSLNLVIVHNCKPKVHIDQ